MFTFSKPVPAAAVTTRRRPAGKSGTSAQVRRPRLPSLVTSAVVPRSAAADALADPPMKLVIDCTC
jgi:hypothetical protein